MVEVFQTGLCLCFLFGGMSESLEGLIMEGYVNGLRGLTKILNESGQQRSQGAKRRDSK